jgi:hypothetical protein
MIVAANHYILGMECPASLRDKMSEGARLLMDLVSKANRGIPVCPIKPQYLFSMDDTVQYVYEGESEEQKADFFISSKKSLAEKDTRSQYRTVESTPQMSGQRIKYTFMESQRPDCSVSPNSSST